MLIHKPQSKMSKNSSDQPESISNLTDKLNAAMEGQNEIVRMMKLLEFIKLDIAEEEHRSIDRIANMREFIELDASTEEIDRTERMAALRSVKY